MTQAAAGRLVDSGLVRAHPELFGERDPRNGRRRALLGRRGALDWRVLVRLRHLLQPRFAGAPRSRYSRRAGAISPSPATSAQLALADPSKSGSAVKAFEMVIQQQMNLRAAELARRGRDPDHGQREARRAKDGTRAMRLIRRIGGNARYFTDSASKIPLDVAMGDAAAGMCIDFYGRFQSETHRRTAAPRGSVSSTPRGGTAMDADPIALLRGAPHRELALEFMEFVISPEGQKTLEFQGRHARRSRALRAAPAPHFARALRPRSTTAFAPIPTSTPTKRRARSSTTRRGPARSFARSPSSFA